MACPVPSELLPSLLAEQMMPIKLEPRVYTTEEFISKLRDWFTLESLETEISVYAEH